jgi:AcrR family transcriptional regulator
MFAMVNRRERGNATRAQLIATARENFGTLGYEATSIETILRAVGITRGALYHHFANKKELFLTVLHEVETDIATAVGVAAARAGRDPAQRLRAACQAWLRLAQDPIVQRIALIDAPSVVGWEAWRMIDEQHFLGRLRDSLQALEPTNAATAELAGPLAHILIGTLNEAALYAARSGNDPATFHLATAAIDHLLAGLLSPADTPDTTHKEHGHTP